MFQQEWHGFLETTESWGVGGFLIRLAIGVGVLFLLYRAFFGQRVDFAIVVKGGRLTYQGKLAAAIRPGLQMLLLDDLALLGPVRITGTRYRDGLFLRFRGNLTMGQKQRIRNFLLSH
jgi:hypothetical protein